jgi:uncharacterized protein YndB with AHSA1/START domain
MLRDGRGELGAAGGLVGAESAVQRGPLDVARRRTDRLSRTDSAAAPPFPAVPVEKGIKKVAAWNVDPEPAALTNTGSPHGGLAPPERMAPPLTPSFALRALRLPFKPTVRRESVVVVRRTLEAPAWRVFCTFAEPEYSMRGWALRDFTVTTLQNEFRAGGVYRVCLRSPEGREHGVCGTYREIVPFGRLVFTHQWDENGTTSPETLVTVTASQEGFSTHVTLEQAGLQSEYECALHGSGWHECFDRIAEHLRTGAVPPEPCRELGPPGR